MLLGVVAMALLGNVDLKQQNDLGDDGETELGSLTRGAYAAR